jgi:hypothetical protein
MSKPSSPALNRRNALLGASAVGALATAVAVMPKAPAPALAQTTAQADPADAPSGYQLTEHVKRYYATARI